MRGGVWKGGWREGDEGRGLKAGLGEKVEGGMKGGK